MTSSDIVTNQPAPAVVVGLCAHGLALCRALSGAGIRVIALEANPELPGVATHCAEVVFTPDINTQALVGALVRMAQERRFPAPPVLLLTNDRMVKVVADEMAVLRAHYRISWEGCAKRLVLFVSKDILADHCAQQGINYPRSRLIAESARLDVALGELQLPVILKPVRPLASFKTLVVESRDAVPSIWGKVAAEMPVLIQEFIPGGDECIRFGALLLDRGRVVARFEGRKLRSYPMGHTTVAISQPDNGVHAVTLQFFAGLEFSGPVSLELKQTSDGRFWVIEPTVGRTDFWVGVTIANGVNLAAAEYALATGGRIPRLRQRVDRIWTNFERDPRAAVWLWARHPAMAARMRIAPVYFDWHDRAPFWRAAVCALRDFGNWVTQKLRRMGGLR